MFPGFFPPFLGENDCFVDLPTTKRSLSSKSKLDLGLDFKLYNFFDTFFPYNFFEFSLFSPVKSKLNIEWFSISFLSE